MLMKQFDQFPKSVKKTIRYIKQDAEYEQLLYLQKVINKTIYNKLNVIKNK